MSRSKSISDEKKSLHRKTGTTDVIVIGAGHAGLATSYCLQQKGIDHLVLERGEIANSWKKERWDSLTLLTPNWQSRLPGFRYEGEDQDGFMTMKQLIQFIEDYADFVNSPLKTGAEVTDVRKNGKGYKISSTAGEWTCKALVIASGACNIPSIPKCGQDLPEDITSLTPHDYRNPDQLEPGGVLIVGASATGLQLADEIRQNGHEVTIATGEHVRMPRTYRGKDIQFWLHKAGILDERYDEVDDINRARKLPSPQLIGANDPRILDLNKLTDQGARLVGRIMGIRDNTAMFSGSLKNVCALADLKMNRMLNTIDEWAEENPEEVPEECKQEQKERFEPTRVDQKPNLTIDFQTDNIKTIIWCTGFQPDYSWLNVDTFDHKGQIKHDGGVAESSGLYVIGLPVLRRRKSSFIHGTEDDVRDISKHLTVYLDSQSTPSISASQ
jgi:putative flavoprotein involved in K+ transport